MNATDDIDEIVRRLREGPEPETICEAADALERLKAERDWQDKYAELQARQIMEQTDEIERLKAERDLFDMQATGFFHKCAELMRRAEAAEAEIERMRKELDQLRMIPTAQASPASVSQGLLPQGVTPQFPQQQMAADNFAAPSAPAFQVPPLRTPPCPTQDIAGKQNAEIERLLREPNELRDRVIELEQEIGRLKAERDELKKDNDALNKRVSDMERGVRDAIYDQSHPHKYQPYNGVNDACRVCGCGANVQWHLGVGK